MTSCGRPGGRSAPSGSVRPRVPLPPPPPPPPPRFPAPPRFPVPDRARAVRRDGRRHALADRAAAAQAVAAPPSGGCMRRPLPVGLSPRSGRSFAPGRHFPAALHSPSALSSLQRGGRAQRCAAGAPPVSARPQRAAQGWALAGGYPVGPPEALWADTVMPLPPFARRALRPADNSALSPARSRPYASRPPRSRSPLAIARR